MARESTEKKLIRVRPPRVQASYDLKVGDAIELNELPFSLEAIRDGKGQPTHPFPELRSRRFVDVNSTNIDSVLESVRPQADFDKEEAEGANGES